jgi:hypothetical protein
MTRKILIDAFKSSELQYNLEEIISKDDKVPIEQIPDATIISEAKYVLEKFTGGIGFEQESDYRGENGPEQKRWAMKEVKALRAFLKKHQVN